MIRPTRFLTLLALAALLLGSGMTLPPAASPPAAPAAAAPAAVGEPPAPAEPKTREANDWVERQMEQLSLREKVAQMFSVWVSGYFQNTGDASIRDVVRLIDDFGLGNVSFGAGDPVDQAALANDLQRHAALPLLVSQDMEWGAGMRLDRTTTFPHAMALGATRTPRFAYETGRITAREARALGVQHLLAPDADVNNNPANPVINTRSFGENPQLVARMVSAFTRGVQDGGAMATAKHFPGHGDTSVDSHLGLPVLHVSRARLDTLELVPFRAAIAAGVGSVMTGHLALPALQSDSLSRLPATLSPDVTGKLLREELGFDGLVITDALTMRGITEGYGAGEAAIRAIEAGADVLLKSEDFYAARDAVLDAVKEGRLSEARIDRSVRRILQAKARLGLPEDRLVDLSAVRRRVGDPHSQMLAETIARQSMTLLRDEGGLFPMTPPVAPARVLVVTLNDGTSAATGRPFRRVLRGAAPAGTALTFRTLDARSDSSDFAGVLAEAKDYGAVLVPAFLRVRSGGGRIRLPGAQRDFLDRLIRREVPVGLVSFGNVYMAAGIAAQPAAYLATYDTGMATQKAAAQAVLGKSPTPGRLPVTIPGAYAYGAGFPLDQVAPRRAAPEAAGLSRRLARVDSLMHASIRDRAFPGAALAVGRGKSIVKLEGYGYHTYALDEPTTPASRFDMASLTKVIATTTSAMKLYEAGRLSLDDRVASYLPPFAQKGKGAVTIRQLLSHSSGLKPYLGAEERGDTRQDIEKAIMAQPLQYEPGTQSDYSGLGIITLQLIIEKITGRSLADYAEEHVFEPLNMTRTGFRSTDAAAVDSSFMPTSNGKDVYYGRVHDPLARQMGGTSGNAGLFSTARDLATFAYMLVNDGRIYGKQFLKKETLDTFTTRAEGLPGTRALGWDTKTMDGYSTAGHFFGPESFGHTGYTGTSLWVDPQKDLFVVFLTNRVYPRGGANHKLGKVRPKLHDLVYRALREKRPSATATGS